MNYLAHIYLSGDDEELKIGNFIADSVKGKKFIHFPVRVQKGIILHRAIDTFTDTHPTVRKSVQKLFQTYGHYSRVIVDIIYDHYLAANWLKYSTVPLNEYVAQFYQLLKDHKNILPPRVQQFLPYMINDNWLYNYSTLEGIEKILIQMNHRTGKKSNMHLAINELNLYYSEFGQEFASFFEDLQNFSIDKVEKL